MPRTYKLTPEGRARISDALRAHWDDPIARAETIARASEAIKAKWAEPEVRQRYLDAFNRRPDVVRKKMVSSAKRGWADPEVRQKRIEGIKASWDRAGAKAERMAAIAAGWVAKLAVPDVPAWVPPSLAGEYIEQALQYDEFDAAKHIRSLLREAK